MRLALWTMVGLGLPAWGGPTVPPEALRWQVTVDPAMQPGQVTAAMDCALRLTAERLTDSPLQVQVTLRLPEALGGRTETYSLPLTADRQATATVPLHFPAGPPEMAVVPLAVRVNGEDYLDQEVRLSKVGPWRVLGPFPGGRAESHDRPFPPEGALDLAASYVGRGGRRIAWQPLDPAAINAEGYHDLNQALGYTEYATAYALAGITVPQPTPARLLIGSDDSIKVWHQGRLVHDHNLHRGSAPAQDSVPVHLVAGENTFLLKVCNDDGWWGFHFDLDDGAGNPVPGLRWNVGVALLPLADPQLRLRQVERTAATLTWQSDQPEVATVYVVPAEPGRRLVGADEPWEAMNAPIPGAEPRVFRTTRRTTHHTFTVTGLQPGQRYLAWVDPAVRGDRSDRLAFYTAPPDGQTHYLRLKLVAAVFTNVTPQRWADQPGARQPCPAAHLERMRREMEETRRFYWINSGMRLLLDVDYLICDEFIATPDDNAYGVGFTEPDETLLRRLLERAGKELHDYDGRLFISLEKHWDQAGQRWTYPASGGGTVGPEGGAGLGKSAWKGGSHNGWLFCHEFGHQLDSLYHYSHGPEYLFNHPQPWDDTAHRHGEHYDANAWLLWEWAGYVTREHQGRPFLPPTLGFRYFLNRWGRVVATADADNDGLPDDAPETPLDEKRLGSSPQAADTDNDGLSDLLEVMACEGVEYGLEEIWAGDPAAHRCDPTNPDSDGDGLPDGTDPYPLYPLDPDLGQGPPRPFVKLRDRAGQADFYLGWDADFFTLRMTAPEAPEAVKIMLDADDDGWFLGRDNFLLRVRPEGGLGAGDDCHVNAAGTFSAALHNCAVPDRWPFFDQTGLSPEAIQFEQTLPTGENGTPYALTIRLPRDAPNGLELVPGERIGLLLAVRPRGGLRRGSTELADAPDQTGMLTVFEPHTFVAITLQGPPTP